MEAKWSHDDVFPIIARAIDELYGGHQSFVEHDAIVDFLLNDSAAQNHIDAALARAETERSREWVAHNMVAWFSQRITVGESDWAPRFQRQQIRGKWAYKPIS